MVSEPIAGKALLATIWQSNRFSHPFKLIELRWLAFPPCESGNGWEPIIFTFDLE